MMETLYDKLMKLRVIPGAYEKWKDYREKLSSHIISVTEKHSTCAVIGAGHCNDFDLSRLSEHFSKITLIDNNIAGVYEGIKNQNADSIRAVEGDILGISIDDYRNFCFEIEAEIRKMKEESGSPERVKEKFLDLMEEAFRTRKPDSVIEDNQADYYICCGVHSQLNNIFPQLAEVYSRYAGFDTEDIFLFASAMNGVIVHEVNKKLLEFSNKAFIAGLESGRVDEKGLLIPDSAVEGAAQGIYDLKREAVVTDEKMLIWPFDRERNKIYNMAVITAQKAY